MVSTVNTQYANFLRGGPTFLLYFTTATGPNKEHFRKDARVGDKRCRYKEGGHWECSFLVIIGKLVHWRLIKNWKVDPIFTQQASILEYEITQ